MPRCVHCGRAISPRFPGVNYRVSRCAAHLVCVAFPSAAATDALLVRLGYGPADAASSRPPRRTRQAA